MNKMKKVLIIENSVAITGSLHAVLRTSIALCNEYEFVFILPFGSKAVDLLREKNFKTYEVPLYEISKSFQSILLYIPRLIRSAYRVRQIARAENISAIHVNDFYNLILPLWKIAGAPYPYLCYVNFVPDRFPLPLRWIWINSHLLFSSHIIAVSNYVLRQLPVHQKVMCIPDALPDEVVAGSEEKKNRLLFLGNFIQGKGQDRAIRAFASIAAHFPDWKMRFVGGDMGLEKNRVYRQSLSDLADELGIATQIEMSGFSSDVAKEYQQASIALNFSVSESFSLTVQEAMFYGCPIIATRSGGPAELIKDHHSGILVTVNDVEQMSTAMKTLIENPAERERLRSNAWIAIREQYSKAKTIELLGEVYREMILSHPR